MAEKEYIEREILKEAIEIAENRINKKKGVFYVDGVLDTLREVKKFIGKIPTADVQEVRHGKNITKIKPVDEFECSECGFICEICENIYYDDCICHREYNPEFCPNCGAKMDEE